MIWIEFTAIAGALWFSTDPASGVRNGFRLGQSISVQRSRYASRSPRCVVVLRDTHQGHARFAPDAVLDGRGLGDRFEGRAAIRSFIGDWFGTYEELEFGLEEVLDLGKGVVFAVVTQDGRPVGSAGHVRQREGWVYVWVGGLIAQLTISDIDEARAAAERLAQERE